MAGMASPLQLKNLENSKSIDFDRLFLQLMIAHHDGAIEMVDMLKNNLVHGTINYLVNLFLI